MAATVKPSPETPEARTAAMRNRIISHMNADHADSLQYYLEYHCGVPHVAASKSTLTDINLDYMIIQSPAGRNLIHFDPPMKSFAEVRERMVQMHHQCLRGLGLSDIKITEFVLPNRLWQWALLGLCFWCYYTLPYPSTIRQPASAMHYGWSLGGNVPALAELAADVGYIVLPFMVIVHAGETAYFYMSRLRKHGMAFSMLATWLWLLNVFASGTGGITRFDSLVEEKQKLKDSKH